MHFIINLFMTGISNPDKFTWDFDFTTDPHAHHLYASEYLSATQSHLDINKAEMMSDRNRVDLYLMLNEGINHQEIYSGACLR